MLDSYNKIYDKLVENEDDLTGIVAYAFYKKHKIEWIKDFVKENNKQPTHDDFKFFYKTTRTSSSLDGFKQQAKNVLANYLYSMEDEYENILQKLEEDYSANLVEQLKEKNEPFWRGVGQSLTASAIFLILIVFGYAGLQYYGKNPPKDIANKVVEFLDKNTD